MFSVSINCLSKMVSFPKIFLSMLPIVLITLLQVKRSNSSIFPWDKHVTIFITNKLTGNLSLGVHCKDKNQDLGIQTLAHGQIYNFTIKPSFIIEVTDYWCSFNWTLNFRTFDVYLQVRDKAECPKRCEWEIHEKWPCKIIGDHTHCYPWNPKAVRVESLLRKKNNTTNV